MEIEFGWDNSGFTVESLSELTRPLFGDLEGFQFDLNLYSMSNYSEVFTRLAEISAPSTIAEIGVFEGKFSRYLLDKLSAFCTSYDFVDTNISDETRHELQDISTRIGTDCRFFEEPSSDYLRRNRSADWIFIDGDHNFETVNEELALIDIAAPRPRIIACHDTGWPCARWDSSYEPARLKNPEAFEPGAISPFSATGVSDYGLELPFIQRRENNESCGVLTAVETFLERNRHYGHLRFTPFYGLSVLWDKRQFSDGENHAIAEIDSDPRIHAAFTGKLELNRVMLLIALQRAGRVWKKQKDYIEQLESRLRANGEQR